MLEGLLTHDEWLERRRYGVSGTDVSILLGLNPYKSKKQLIADKLGLSKPFVGNSFTFAGQKLEPYVADYWADRHKAILINGELTEHPTEARFIGTPDFLVGDGSGLEIKTGGEKTFLLGCPKYYEIQCAWYMFITERERWTLNACLVPKNRALIPDRDLDQWVRFQPQREYEFRRNPALERQMQEAALWFLEELEYYRTQAFEPSLAGWDPPVAFD